MRKIIMLTILSVMLLISQKGLCGPVIISGLDTEYGIRPGNETHGKIAMWSFVIQSGILNNVMNNPSGPILVIGGGKAATDEMTRFWTDIGISLTKTITFVYGGPAISIQDFTGFSMIAICNTAAGSGRLTSAEYTAISNRQTDIGNFVNSGGGLFASACNISPFYQFINIGSPSLTTVGSSGSNSTPTAAGTAMGISTIGGPFHNTFSQWPSFLSVLSNLPGNLPCILGGANVTIPVPSANNAHQFVKTYGAKGLCPDTTKKNLKFHCITKSLNSAPTFYIAGIQDTSVYIAEVNANGTVLQEKLIGVRSKTYSLRSMITDDDGNIVIVGYATTSYPVKAFIMKISSALSIIYHRTFSNPPTTGTSSMFFSDIKDNKNNGKYSVAGGIRNSAVGPDVLLVNLDRTTGAITNYYRGNVQSEYYDALTLTPNQTTYVSGTVGITDATTFRPWLGNHTGLSFSWAASERFLVPISTATPARLYGTGLVQDGTNLLFAWGGHLTGTALAINTGITNVNTITGGLNWQKEYTFTPFAEGRKVLTRVASDPKGYVAEGNWWNGSSVGNDGGSVGEMILLRTEKNGTPVWSRKIKNVLVNSATHNASFVIDANYIYAVGYQTSVTSAMSEGVLVKIPLLDGAMDTTCSVVQKTTVKNNTYIVNDVLNSVTMSVKDTSISFPVNCVMTDSSLNCNNPCNGDTTKLNADFDLTGTLQSGNTTNYLVNASSFSTAPNSQWIVSETYLTGTYDDIPGTSCGPHTISLWGTSPTPVYFGGYLGLSGCNETNGTSLNFKTYRRYRFKHILSYLDGCGIVRSDTVSKTILMCPGCRNSTGKGATVETDGASSTAERSSKQISSEEESSTSLRLMPNPVTGSSVTIEYFTKATGSVSVKIVDMHGRQVAVKALNAIRKGLNKYNIDTRQLSNGAYSMIIMSEGKTTTQKFVVANR